MEKQFRQLAVHEIELLEKLLDHEFPGRDALRKQISSVTGRQLDQNGSLELRTSGTDWADVLSRCPTEGTCKDIDGGQIAVLLHVVDGKLHQMEIFKEDGSDLLRPPIPEDLNVY